jgi:hypothetical protein
LFICYIAAYLDRVNVGFAKLQMQADVPQISDSVFGLGAGIFFLGYFVFEVPSNMLMEKVGARIWIARIMVTWGIVSTGMIFVNSPWAFLWTPFIARFCRSRFFSGNDSLSHLLVSVASPGGNGRPLYACDRTNGSDRCASLGLDSTRVHGRGRVKRVANAFFARRNTFDSTRFVCSMVACKRGAVGQMAE